MQCVSMFFYTIIKNFSQHQEKNINITNLDRSSRKTPVALPNLNFNVNPPMQNFIKTHQQKSKLFHTH